MRLPLSTGLRKLAMVAVPLLLLAACTVDSVDEATQSDAPADSASEAAVSEDAGSEAPAGDGETLSLAMFASSSQNGYNQAIYEGMQAAAEEAGGVETEIFDGEFNADVQFNQIEDAVASGRFDGFLIVPNDTVGVAEAVQAALDEDITVASALFPIGPDLNTLEPQLDGIITAAAPVAPQARELAQGAADYCADKDPCRVIIMIGQLQFPFDNLRHESMLEVLNQHDNIEVLATGEGNYDRDQSLTVMQDLIQAHGEFDVLLSNADQHVAGAMIALESAGVDIPSMYIAGGGATTEAVEGIQQGTWDATAVNFPFSEGSLATTEIVKALRGEDYNQVIDITQEGSIPVSVVTAETLEQYPDWEPEWDG